MSRPDAEAIAQQYAQRAKVADRMERAQLEALASAEAWPQWAAVAARFPGLSPRNHLLVLAQQPSATLLLCSSEWRDVGRWPKRGSTALRLWQTRPIKGEKGRVTGSADILAPVFDVTQTDGEPVVMMPTPAPPQPGRAPRGMAAALAAAATELGWTMRQRPVPTSDAPTLDATERIITVDAGGDQLSHCIDVTAALMTAATTDLTGSPEQRAAIAAAAASVVWASHGLPSPSAVRPLPEWRHDLPLLTDALTAAAGIAWQVSDVLAAHAVGTTVACSTDPMPPPPPPPTLVSLERTA